VWGLQGKTEGLVAAVFRLCENIVIENIEISLLTCEQGDVFFAVFEECFQCKITHLLGHTIQTGDGDGAVLKFEKCEDVQVTHLTLGKMIAGVENGTYKNVPPRASVIVASKCTRFEGKDIFYETLSSISRPTPIVIENDSLFTLKF
jgi:hypothetical protein